MRRDAARTASDSASPMTSWIHTTWYGSSWESPRETGLDPARPKSMSPEAMASLTAPPESNSFHSIFVSGSAFSSSFCCLTMRSPLGMAW